MICPKCQHQAEYPGETTKEVLRCSECGARIAYGVLQPEVVIQPDAKDPRFVEFIFDGIKHTVDRQLGHAIGINVLSITPPPQ